VLEVCPSVALVCLWWVIQWLCCPFFFEGELHIDLLPIMLLIVAYLASVSMASNGCTQFLKEES
jgi:hypothetical protein